MSFILPLVVGITLFILSMYLLLRSRALSAILRVTPGLLLMVCAFTLIFGGLDIMSYRQLLKEEAVATLHFEILGPQTYGVMMIDKDNRQQYFHLKGDQWQLDARMIRWHPNLVRAGFQPIYRLERIAGRYNNFQQELHAERTVHEIGIGDSGIDNGGIGSWGVDTWRWFNQWQWLHAWVDATYGTATFVPMADGAIYEVSMSHSGLVARPINNKSRQAVATWQ
jgi:hypothetical protein